VTAKHPAVFTNSIIDALRELIPQHIPEGLYICDPFAGDGQKLGALCDELGRWFRGIDIEEWPDSRATWGDSTEPYWYPDQPHAIVTSPTYNNGVNDHFKPSDASRRLTYRSRLGRELHVNNTGRYSGRGSKKAEQEYWRITEDVVKHWPDIALVNVKDSIRGDSIYPLVNLWRVLLLKHGYKIQRVDVPCPGWRFGANSELRVDTEAILIAKRP
jgi:hypothetical protein